ncbi:hypothetical protein AVDCRST_MAG81-3903 [uncultured Synechococcales cyanobacterium]|uniref:Uncharacterized protein n=1 Tax=uncultured Synechococcales cyanobacterium TaxID=1936017 RepID=A0A6J4VRD5_9CYAN|nr:hypothetical protein AVDCRST_MAG81-3903 [uncultured Synechococcales cyanobacterium]
MKNPRPSNLVVRVCVALLALFAALIVGGLALQTFNVARENSEGLRNLQQKLIEKVSLVLR